MTTPSYLTARRCEDCGSRMSPFMPRKSREDGKKVCPMCAGKKTAAVIYCEPGDHDYQGPDVFAHEGHFSCPDHHEILRVFALLQGGLEDEASAAFELLEPEVRQRFASLRRVGHDSGDGETIFHCPFCGSGQVTASSDGTVECDFCKTRFTVQVQPQQAAMPQTINGVPQPMPGMPGDPTRAVVDDQANPMDPNAPPGAEQGAEGPPGADPGASPDATPPGTPTSDPGGHPGNPPGAPNPGDDQKSKGSGNEPPWLRKKKTSGRYYLTAQGFTLDEEAFERHLALRHAPDRDAILSQIQAEKETA